MNIYNYPGDQKTKEILRRFDSKISLDEIKSLFMGSILAVEMVSPVRVLEMLNSEDSEPEFESLADAREHMGMLMALWNKLTDHQSPDSPFRFSEIPNLDVNDKNGWLTFSKLRESEIRLFLRGLYAGNTPSAGELYEPREGDLRSYLPFLLETGRKALLKLHEEMERGTSALPPAVLGALALNIDETYLSLYGDFVKESLHWRKKISAKN